jgi:hypothetical protein
MQIVGEDRTTVLNLTANFSVRTAGSRKPYAHIAAAERLWFQSS